MLADSVEKSRNPLTKAIKRRNAKKVQFSPPTYVEASDVEYSTEEEDEEADGEYPPNEEERSKTQDVEQEPHQDENATVEPLRFGSRDSDTGIDPPTQMKQGAFSAADQNSSIERARTSDDMFEATGNPLAEAPFADKVLIILDKDATGKSRKGTLRNTDSLFKDDNTETRKINLTPSLLRDDSSSSTTRSIEPKEVRTQIFVFHAIWDAYL